jgi:hypothetical protein
MNKLVLRFFFLFCFVLNAAFAQNSNLQFKSVNQFIGNISENEIPLLVSFAFKNTGNNPIVIVNVNVPDDTKVTNWNKLKPIKPGESGNLTFRYNRKIPGVFNQKIVIKTNEPNVKPIELTFGGELIIPKTEPKLALETNFGSVKLSKNVINFGNIKNTEKKRDTIALFNLSHKAVRIENYELNGNYVKIDVFPEELRNNGKGVIIVNYDPNIRNAFGNTTDTVWIKSDEGDNLIFPIIIKSDIYEDFSKMKPEKLKLAPKAYLVNTNYDFRFVKKGTEVKTTFNIKNKGKTQLLIRKVDVSCPCIDVKYPEKVRFDRDSPIDITVFTNNLKGKIHETITIVTNDPSNPRITLHIMGIVE